VPTGYKFHPVLLSRCVERRPDRRHGYRKVTDNDTELVNGPAPVLSTWCSGGAVARVGIEPIAAGHKVGVSITTDASYAPTTADLDAVIGVLLPA
jgi:hypothetical protein